MSIFTRLGDSLFTNVTIFHKNIASINQRLCFLINFHPFPSNVPLIRASVLSIMLSINQLTNQACNFLVFVFCYSLHLKLDGSSVLKTSFFFSFVLIFVKTTKSRITTYHQKQITTHIYQKERDCLLQLFSFLFFFTCIYLTLWHALPMYRN